MLMHSSEVDIRHEMAFFARAADHLVGDLVYLFVGMLLGVGAAYALIEFERQIERFIRRLCSRVSNFLYQKFINPIVQCVVAIFNAIVWFFTWLCYGFTCSRFLCMRCMGNKSLEQPLLPVSFTRSDGDGDSAKPPVVKLKPRKPRKLEPGDLTDAEMRELAVLVEEKIKEIFPPDKQHWSQLFKRTDEDGSGLVGLEEVTAMIRRDLAIPQKVLPEAKLKAMWKWLDEDGSGDINTEEFGMFMSLPYTMAGPPAPPPPPPSCQSRYLNATAACFEAAFRKMYACMDKTFSLKLRPLPVVGSKPVVETTKARAASVCIRKPIDLGTSEGGGGRAARSQSVCMPGGPLIDVAVPQRRGSVSTAMPSKADKSATPSKKANAPLGDNWMEEAKAAAMAKKGAGALPTHATAPESPPQRASSAAAKRTPGSKAPAPAPAPAAPAPPRARRLSAPTLPVKDQELLQKELANLRPIARMERENQMKVGSRYGADEDKLAVGYNNDKRGLTHNKPFGAKSTKRPPPRTPPKISKPAFPKVSTPAEITPPVHLKSPLNTGSVSPKRKRSPGSGASGYAVSSAFGRLTAAQNALQAAIDNRKREIKREKMIAAGKDPDALPKRKKVNPWPPSVHPNIYPQLYPDRRQNDPLPMSKGSKKKAGGQMGVDAWGLSEDEDEDALLMGEATMVSPNLAFEYDKPPADVEGAPAMGAYVFEAGADPSGPLKATAEVEEEEEEDESEDDDEEEDGPPDALKKYQHSLSLAWQSIWAKVQFEVLPEDVFSHSGLAVREPDTPQAVADALEELFPTLFDVFAHYSLPLKKEALKTAPFLLALDGWLKFAKHCKIDEVGPDELTRIFERSRPANHPRAKSGVLGIVGFLEALIAVSLKLQPSADEVPTSSHVAEAVRDLVASQVAPNAHRRDVLTFRAAMLGSVPLLHAFDVLGSQLYQVHKNYANYDGKVDAQELLDMCKHTGMLDGHITEEEVIAAFACSLPVGEEQPRMLRNDGTFQECVLRLALSYSEEDGAEPMKPYTVTHVGDGLSQAAESELLKRLAITAHTLTDTVAGLDA